MGENKQQNQYKKLGKDTVVFAISNFSSKILIFLLLPLYTNCLTTEEYGIVDLINNIITILFPILTLSVIEGILRFSFEKTVKKSDVISIAIVSVLSSSALLCACTPIAYLIGGTIWKYWHWILLVFGGYCLSMTISYYLRGINQSKFVAIQGVTQTAITVIGNVILLLVLNRGMHGYVFSLIFSYYATSLFTIIYTKIYKDFRSIRINIELFKEMLKYCIPMIPSKIAWWMNNSLDKYYIIYFCGIGTSGLYSVAHKIPSFLSVLTEIFNQAWQISAIEMYTNNSDENNMYNKVHSYYIYFSVLCAAVLIALARILGKLLFAKDFFIAWEYVPMLILAAVFASLSGFYHSIFRAAKMSKQLGVTVVAGTVGNIIFNSILVPTYGAYGAAIATVIGFIIEWTISYIFALKVVDLSISLKKIIMLFILIGIECALTVLGKAQIMYVAGDILIISLIVVLVRKEMLEIIKKLISIFKGKMNVLKR